ncbi:MAG: nuclear transport factor 2 family protein [Terracidiphilus sp.]
MRSQSIAVVVVCAALCGVLLQAQSAAGNASGQPADAQPSHPDWGPFEQQIVSEEREGLDALKAGEPERFGDLTADEAVMVDDHGPASKAQVLKNVAGFRLTDYTMDDVRFVPISENTGLISYKIVEKGISHGHEFVAQAYISSVWTERGTKWLCLFSQETAAR